MVTKNGKKHFLLFLVLGISISGGLFTFQAISPVDALTADEQKAIDDREKELKEINAKIKAYKQIVDLKEKQGNTLAGQIATLETQAQKLEREIRENEQTLDNLGRELRDTEAGISEKERFILRQKQVLSGLVREYHASTADGAEILFAFDVDDAGIPMKHDDWLAETGGRIGALLRSMEETKRALLASRETLDKKKTEVGTLQEQLEQRNEYLDISKENKTSLLTKTQTEQKKYASLVKTLEQEREEIQLEIENIESGKIDQLTGLPGAKSGVLSYPLASTGNTIPLCSKSNKTPCISQGYGKTSYASHYKSGMHNGIDFASSSGTPILAAANGKIIGTGNLGRLAYGKWIAIDHDNGLVTLYGHLSSIDVSKGNVVKRGERIGKMGSTGDSTGPHVHFTVYAKDSYEIVDYRGKALPVGASVNPTKYLP